VPVLVGNSLEKLQREGEKYIKLGNRPGVGNRTSRGVGRRFLEALKQRTCGERKDDFSSRIGLGKRPDLRLGANDRAQKKEKKKEKKYEKRMEEMGANRGYSGE